MNADPSIESEIRNHAWNYFSLHAQQRMSVFQFYITLEIALFGSVFLVVQFAKDSAVWFSVVGVLIALLSFVFWKIDQRTRDLIKNAEQSLIDVENYLIKNYNFVSDLPFRSDAQLAGGMKAFPLYSGRISYSKCFGLIFLICGVLGLAASGWLIVVGS